MTAGTLYRICAESADVQESERLDSDIIGSLSQGDEIEVLETLLLQRELTVRLRFEGGWISLSAPDETPIAEVVEVLDVDVNVEAPLPNAPAQKKTPKTRAPELDAIESVDEIPTISEVATLLRASFVRRRRKKKVVIEEPDQPPQPTRSQRLKKSAVERWDRSSKRCGHFATTWPCCTLFLGLVTVGLLILIGALTAPIGVETDLDDFLTADVEASIMYDIYKEAGTSQYGNSRRLAEDANIFIIKDIAVVYQLASTQLQHGILHDVPLAEISSIEAKLRALSGWTRLCNSVYSSSRAFCEPGISYVNYLNSGGSGYVLNITGTNSPIAPDSAYLAIEDANLEDLIFGVDFDPEADTYQASELRSVWRFKIPCCRNTESLSVRQSKAREVHDRWDDFLSDELLPLLRTTAKDLEDDEESTIIISYDGTGFLTQEIIEALYHDMVFAILAFIFVLGYMLFHTRSPILAFLGLFVALLSLPLAYFTCAIFGADSVSFASFLAVFLLVGFTCDVIFIYSDFWHMTDAEFKLSQLDPSLELQKRPIWAFKKGWQASGPTMITTAVSFFANATSPFRALRQFGVFVGFCVVLAWLLLTLSFPSLYVLDHRLHQSGCWQKCCFFMQKRCTRFTWKQYASYLRRFRWCYFFVPLLCGLVFAGLLVPLTTFNSDDVSILPTDNPVGRMDIVEDELFATRSIPSEPPDTEIDLCTFADSATSSCLYATCLDGFSQTSWDSSKITSGVGSLYCPCYRSYVNDNCTSPPWIPTATTRVFFDFEPNSSVRDQMEAEVSDYWSSSFWATAYEGDASLVTLDLMLTEWTTGEQTTLYAMDLDGRANKTSGTSEACGFADICFCSAYACDMTSITGWSSIQRMKVAASSMSRRLSEESAGAEPELEPELRSDAYLEGVAGGAPEPGTEALGASPAENCFESKGCNGEDGVEDSEWKMKRRGEGAPPLHGSRSLMQARKKLLKKAPVQRPALFEAASAGAEAKGLARARRRSEFARGGWSWGRGLGAWEALEANELPTDEPWPRLSWDRYHPAADARRLATTPRTLLAVVFGLKIDTDVPALASIDLENAWEFDPDVDFADPWTQRNLYSYCQAVSENADELKIQAMTCWMNIFYDCQATMARRFPALPEEFHEYALECGAATSYTLWLSGDEVVGMASVNMVAYSTSDTLDTLRSYRDKWNTLLAGQEDAYNENAFMISPLWVQIEKQEAIIVGTALTMGILLAVIMVIMMLFTKSWVLSLWVCLATILALAYLLGFCVAILGWEMGMIQAVALIYFVGYGVTFPLHVAHLYAVPLTTQAVPSKRREAFQRLLRTQASLQGIGSASVGSALTTAGAAFFLIFCSLTVFQDLGAMCLIVTAFSLFVALVPLPSALLAFGPINLTGKINWCCCRDCCKRPFCSCCRRKQRPPESPSGQQTPTSTGMVEGMSPATVERTYL